jgi:2-hydroxychromene-2-carboxylate isomerase
MARTSRVKRLSPVPGMAVLRVPQVVRPDTSQPKAQKRFKKLLQGLRKRRQELRGWEEFARQYQSRVQGELLPLGAHLRERRIATAHLLDRLATSSSLNRRQQGQAKQILTRMISSLLRESPTPAVIALHDKYSTSPYSEVQQGEFENLHDIAQHLGLDPREYAGAANSEDFTDWLESKMRDAQAAAAEDLADELDVTRPRRRREAGDASESRSPAVPAAHDRQQLCAADAKRRLTKLFRRIASFVHPDRPTDETKAQRAHKEVLFKRAALAREEGDMLTLLDIEMELGIEARGATSVADTQGLAAEHLAAYLHLLETQHRHVQEKIAQILTRLGLDRSAAGKRAVTPAAVNKALDAEIASAQDRLNAIRADIALFEDPRRVRQAIELLWQALFEAAT